MAKFDERNKNNTSVGYYEKSFNRIYENMKNIKNIDLSEKESEKLKMKKRREKLI